jgi:LysM repeat protein
MKIPIFSKLTAKTRGRKVVRASARAMRAGEDDYYETEPNMKLSHAFMVVLVLHVVAVGGIYAFNQIKVNKKSDLLGNITERIAQATGSVAPAVAPVAPAAPAVPVVPQRQPGDADEPLPAMQTSLPEAPVVATAASAPAEKKVIPAPVVAAAPKVDAKPASPAVTTTAPAKKSAVTTYTVAKGDNPYTIAKKIGVSYQDLLKVNGIDDPTKLQIGQVLKVPGAAN